MKIVNGIKIGGLQQKIFNLMLLIILALFGAFVSVSLLQHRHLRTVVAEAGERQQASIAEVSESTMQAALNESMTKSTALQAYIADDLFSDVRSDVLTLQSFATELFEHQENVGTHPFYLPDAANAGIPSAFIQHETGVDPAASESLGLVANMSEIMLAMYQNSRELSSCLVATADGNILVVNDRAGYCVSESGEVYDFPVRERPWYRQAAEAGELVFTGVEADAFTGIPGLVCAAPVYCDGELAAVVAADVFLTSISDYVRNSASENGYVCVVGSDGKVLFSPEESGSFQARLSAEAPDLRQSENEELGAFICEALVQNTGIRLLEDDGKALYVSGAPLSTVNWAVLSVVDRETTLQPTISMLQRYGEISEEAQSVYREGSSNTVQIVLALLLLILLLAVFGALALAGRIVRPLEQMTRRINTLSGGDTVFQMEDVYRTGDEIEILAESFTELSTRTRDYIARITEITAEKERIGTELALANRIQADMLPNIYPAFPDRPEFDIYAVMDPAREVGGDFYDFFLVDENHLCMIMADVSGKGVPAALFMMASKILLNNQAMSGKSPAEILRAVNDAICANNREEMFVTVWLGILEISTGIITAANAGHEYPVLMQSGRRFELIKDKHGFVIGGMPGMKYREYELQLQPGAKLFVYTDGVPEANNNEGKLFGAERMLAALNENPGGSTVEILKTVRRHVDEFAGGAEQFDDLTMLCMEYRGQTELFTDNS